MRLANERAAVAGGGVLLAVLAAPIGVVAEFGYEIPTGHGRDDRRESTKSSAKFSTPQMTPTKGRKRCWRVTFEYRQSARIKPAR